MSAIRTGHAAVGASALALSLALAFTACTQSDPVEAPAASSPAGNPGVRHRLTNPYIQDVLALKAQKLSRAETEAGILALQKRYGIATPAAALAPDAGLQTDPVLPEPIPGTEEKRTAPAGLGKAAAVTTVYKTKKSFNFGNARVILHSVNVPAGGYFQSWVEPDINHPEVDPVAVAYYKTPGSSGDVYTFIVAGVSDDSVDLEPSLLWSNQTGVSQKVTVVAFAYSASTSGPGTLVILPTNTDRFDYPGWVGGTQVYYNTANPLTTGCHGPFLSRITLKRLTGSASTRGMLAVNEVTRRGGYILNQNASLNLADVLPEGNVEVQWNPSFVLGFSLAGNYDTFPVTTFNAVQADQYTCDVF